MACPYNACSVSAGGVDSSLGATERYLEEAEIKQALADHAAEVILAAATSKLDAPELAQSIGWDRISFSSPSCLRIPSLVHIGT